MEPALIVVLVVVLIILFANIRIVSQSDIYIIERLGKFKKEWHAGIHVKIPIIDKIANKLSSKEMLLDFPKQRVITKDNVAMEIDTVVFAKIVDAKKYTYAVARPLQSLENLSATNLRNLVGAMDLDETLTSRDVINAAMEKALDEATAAWGLDVTRVEVKDILPPHDIQEVMTKQMRAEREKRQTLLEAEAHKQSIVTRAEGDKEAKVLAAQAESEAQIALAKGKAESIRLVYEAEAKGIEALNAAKMSDRVLQLKAIEAMKQIADGNATKIFMPTDIAQIVSSLGVIGESLGIGDSIPAAVKLEKPKAPLQDACLKPQSSNTTHDVAMTEHMIDQSVREDFDTIGQ